ncbi:MAG: tRNA 2-thiouridine(34) synthase MnmA [Phycisphaerae bacterium]
MTRHAKTKVLLAMSGGVDSSVAADLLLEQGHEVHGCFLRLGHGKNADTLEGICSNAAHAADAQAMAERLDIPLQIVDMDEQFRPVVEYFTREYVRGRTPNPCLFCNRLIKFGLLVEIADDSGCEFLTTGHYARRGDPEGEPAVLRGVHRPKDQSYALFGIRREYLSRILLPIGEIGDKQTVRDRARQLGLEVHDKPDSQEVCFVPDDDYVSFIADRAPETMTPGQIVDTEGNVLGRHDGYGKYTIGQRRGLGVAMGEPYYVTHIDAEAARVTIGPKEQVMMTRLQADNANWHTTVPEEFHATAQIRYNHAGAPARIRRTPDGCFSVEFDEPVHAITPGQAVVIYRNDRLLGGGWIR